MKRRVLRWYDYSWSRGRIQGGGDINTALGLLPDKLKTELALHVNLNVLKKVWYYISFDHLSFVFCVQYFIFMLACSHTFSSNFLLFKCLDQCCQPYSFHINHIVSRNFH